MMISPLYSVFYVITLGALFGGFFTIEKSKEKQNALAWVPVGILSFLCFNVLAAAILNFFLPINLISMGVVNLVVAGALWFTILRKKKVQKYYIEKFDIIVFAVVIVLVVLLTLKQFTPDLIPAYATSDPGVHLRGAIRTMNIQKASGMFFSSLNNSLFISVFAPLTTLIWYFRFFILFDCVMLALSALMFYILIKKYAKTRATKICSLLVTCVYMLGYPLNNTVFGYIYLGAGVAVISLLLFLCNEYLREGFNRSWNIFLMMLGALGIFMSYMLFMPVTYIAVFAAVAIYHFRRKELFRWKTLLTEAVIFVVPILIGLYYMFFGYFGGTTEGVELAFNAEGYIYRDLYSNFILILPFVIYGLATRLRKKKFAAPEILMVALCLFTFVLFWLCLNGKISTYYYYKLYYPLWLLAFYFLQAGLSFLLEKSKLVVISYVAVCAFLAGMTYTGADQIIQEKQELLNLEGKSGTYLNIFVFNRVNIGVNKKITEERMELYSFVEKNIGFDDKPIPLIDDWEQVYWYEGISGQPMIDYYYWKGPWDSNYSDNVILERLQEGSDYAIVVPGNDLAENESLYFNSLERVFENEIGYVVKIR